MAWHPFHYSAPYNWHTPRKVRIYDGEEPEWRWHATNHRIKKQKTVCRVFGPDIEESRPSAGYRGRKELPLGFPKVRNFPENNPVERRILKSCTRKGLNVIPLFEQGLDE